MVVVGVKGVIEVVELRGAIFYIFTGMVVQLTLLNTCAYQDEIGPGRGCLKVHTDGHTKSWR